MLGSCRSAIVATVAAMVFAFSGRAEEPAVFSGPQPGEPLGAFQARGVYDDLAGENIDIVERAGNAPLLLVFVHAPLTRPSAAVARGLAEYAAENSEKLKHATVWLHDDRSEAEAYLRRARASLNLKGTVLVSLDGADGPGVLGLNRDVSLTVLVARDGHVAANFALVQPSTTDGPAIVAALANIAGTSKVTQVEFDALCRGGDRAMQNQAGEAIPRALLAAVINKQASEEEVRAAAQRVEAFVGEHPARRRELGRIARAVVDGGKLENYGTPAAQDQLRRWARQYGHDQRGSHPEAAPQSKTR